MNLVETGYAAGWRVVRALPRPVGAALFAAGAEIAVRRNTRGVARLRENLRRVVGDADLEALVRRGVDSYVRFFLEAFRLPCVARGQNLAGLPLGGAVMPADLVAHGLEA